MRLSDWSSVVCSSDRALGLGCRLRLHALQRKRGFGRGRGGRRMLVVIFRRRAMAVTGLTGHVHAFHVGSTVGVLIGGLTVAMATVLTHMHVLVRRGLGDDRLVLRSRQIGRSSCRERV